MILTAEQRGAVKHDSHVVLTACPGSGKTRTLVAKLLRCIEEVRATPRRVACITYTNAAVHEIEHRLREYCQNGDDDLCDVSTIHTFCLNNVLRSFFWRIPALSNGFGIAAPETEEFTQTAFEVVEKYHLDKDALQNFEHLSRNLDGSPNCPEHITPAAASKFWELLESKGFLDFCSIVYWTYHLIQTYPTICDGISSRFTWILIDEFQDTSAIQVEIFLAIASRKQTRFFAVGDPCQSIYAFSGARPELMEEFRKQLNAKGDFYLASNFRSSVHVITHAERLIARLPTMKALGGSANYDFEPAHVQAETKFAALVDYFLPILEERQIPHGRAAILAPTWFALVPLARQLRDYGVPVVGPGARPYKSTRVFARLSEQICAYVENPKPERIAEIEKELFILATNLNGKADYQLFSYDGRRAVYELIESGRVIRNSSESAINWLQVAAVQFAEILCSHDITGQECKSVLEESVQLMLADMEKQKIDSANLTLADLGMFACPDSNLKLLTLHSAKGREFDAVAMVDVHEGKIPYWKDQNDPRKLEESTRLFYVGLTRARCILVYVTDDSHPKNKPTRFLKTVNPRTPSLSQRLVTQTV